ncbi:MAG TPA: dethiobiotin synthase [Acidimicrobiia bacterium]|nr:dethiobiotin synthase [Acidimicrobiia bacterium]
MIVVVTGTGTEVGKTWFTAATIDALRADGRSVVARKPVQSFDPADAHPTDADVLARATGELPETVCPRPRWLPKAVAPPMAADALGLPSFTIAELAVEVRAGTGADDAILFVEGAGGARSPIAEDGDTVALAHALAADVVVIVADAGLGTINAVRLTVAALGNWTPIVALNRFDARDELHIANRDWLRARDGYEVVTDPAQLAAALTLRGSPRARS